MTTHQIWSCHVTLATNFKKFYFSPSSVLNFRNNYQFEENWLKNKKVTGKKQNSEWITNPPPVLIGLKEYKNKRRKDKKENQVNSDSSDNFNKYSYN